MYNLINFLAGTVLDDIGEAITAVGEWIVSMINSLIPIFWNSTASTPTFTFIGWLTVIGFGLGLVFTLIRVIRSYVRV